MLSLKYYDISIFNTLTVHQFVLLEFEIYNFAKHLQSGCNQNIAYIGLMIGQSAVELRPKYTLHGVMVSIMVSF